jgi:predicted DNA-binding transcriptional regulator YafY
MPKATHHSAIARLLEILRRLPSRGPGLTARDLTDWLEQEGYEVTKRTVERDLIELSCHFPLRCNDKSTPYGWHWMQGDGPDLPSLTVADAVSLTVVENLLRPLLPGAVLESIEPRFRQARRKLAALSETNPKARWADKVRHVPPTLPLLPPKITDGVLEAVQDALLADRQLEVAYKRPEAEETQSLCLHPLGLIQRGPVTYLAATAFDYADVRLYAVHRIQEAKQMVTPSQRPDGFTLDAYIGQGALQFGNGEKIRLVARVSEWLATILMETPLASDQQLRKVGQEFRLSVTVYDTWQLRWWILSLGPEIVVQRPNKLRNQIIESITSTGAGYDSK